MKIQWQKPLIDKRMIVVLLLEVLLLISSLALYFDQQNSKLLQQVHDPVMTVFMGAMPDRFASSRYGGCFCGLDSCLYPSSFVPG